jgi:glycosyltransferase involved in cell wall biosynthesis
MKFVLILMVRNESKILRRCLEALVGTVDAFCIHDTGSTDNTRDIAREFLKDHLGIVTRSEWKNFGTNRTTSFEEARNYVMTLDWDPKETYGILLDADMVLVPGTLKQETLTEVGYALVQLNGNLEYPNCRLVRMDYEWKCLGVTHEYWDGPTKNLAKTVAYIQDMNDGGCKSDKFERDARLLEEGLREDPKNARYMFYLAQTYNALGRLKEAIEMYKKRITAGGWFEEIWFSHYMIAKSYLSLGDPIKFEAWMLRAYKYRSERAESMYMLTKHFREVGDHYKAYGYLQKGKRIPLPSDSLFIEKDVYTEAFEYEETILDFYVGKEREGLRSSMNYLLKGYMHNQSVLNNMVFYVRPLVSIVRNHSVLRNVFGNNYHPTSTCIFEHKGKTYHNVRFVNYDIDNTNGAYMMKDGGYAAGHRVRTQNAIWTPNETIKMRDGSVTLPRKDKHILGLEDVRVYINKSGDLCFTATTAEYSEKIRVLHGKYHLNGTYSDCEILESPKGHECEKNWIPVNKTNDVIYGWNPLEVGTIADGTLKFHTSHSTPWFFQHLRGSAVPVEVNGELWCLVHYVEHSSPRKYFHCFVALEPETYKPKAISLPFVFREKTIEYCLGVQVKNDVVVFTPSLMDNDPCVVECPVSQFEWLHV